ncbi:class I adenylate-forming enzyme family protein [Thalassovita mediterranea]|jgi:long-chain acyl-CoA synthetase|uniref:Long-chain-fatty-acid--CoA ligase n=1 Tax=Thalassovita mediterranea TaxID=340021 RepID=A0A0P1H1P8_9RHOB|nr:AMP-binding protein [Thalassovita mediterranea]CUH84137.1 Long-chain-fatty-acid--CoA ligase [Thalassovita mediterranea]SIS27667.1 long-chain acyl-CoA synthetase [Thalassovita mediterranea]
MNPAEWLARTARRDADRPALLHGEVITHTYSQFHTAAARLGAGLLSRGIGKGDRIAVFMSNRIDYLIALYGIWFTGAAAVPINAKLHPKEADWIIENADCALTLSDDARSADLTRPAISVDGTEWADLIAMPPMPRPVDMDSSDMAWLFYTSGTTGKPKGVIITCGNIASMVSCYFIDVDDVLEGDAILYAAPMSHGAGLYNFMHVIRGARHVVPDSGGFEPAEILSLGRALGSVTMFAAPTMVRRLVDCAKASGSTGEGLRTICYAGGPMYEADILEAVAVMGPRFVQIYGQGECPMGITALPRHDVSDRTHPNWRARLNSVGKAQTTVQVRIMDAAGVECPIGTSGEITVRGDTVMPGYWRNTDATTKTLREGWLWTGDMGTMDTDGYVTLQDRSKDMIISGGSNIYPREVEEVLLSHPEVSEVAVVGRPHADWGEEVVAFIVGTATAEGLDALCLDQIARFKRPKTYLNVSELPKNNYGKVLKTELRTKLARRPEGN